jgi:transketolase
LESISIARGIKEKPTMIIANTIKGKGISFMENDVSWHGKAPNYQEYLHAVKELSGEEDI